MHYLLTSKRIVIIQNVYHYTVLYAPNTLTGINHAWIICIYYCHGDKSWFNF